MANFTFISFYFILFFSFAILPLDQIRRHQFNDLRATTGPVKRVKFNGGATESVCKVTHNLTATFPMPKWFKSKWICESFLKNCWPLVPLSLIHHFRLFCLLCLKKQTKEKDFFFCFFFFIFFFFFDSFNDCCNVQKFSLVHEPISHCQLWCLPLLLFLYFQKRPETNWMLHNDTSALGFTLITSAPMLT